jgi:hypothetical protein
LPICRLRCLPHTRRHRQVSKKTSVAITFKWAAGAALAHAASATTSRPRAVPSARHFSAHSTVRDLLQHVTGASGSRALVNALTNSYELWRDDAPLPRGVPLSRLALPSPCALTVQRRSGAPAGSFEVYVKTMTGKIVTLNVYRR